MIAPLGATAGTEEPGALRRSTPLRMRAADIGLVATAWKDGSGRPFLIELREFEPCRS
jgi:hypothetical protein